MKKCYSGSPRRGKPDRKTVERNRRIQMKGLSINLTSVIPPHHFQPSKEVLSQVDQLDQAASYIKQLRERIEELKKRKEELVGMSSEGSSGNIMNMGSRSRRTCRHRLPMVELRELGSSIEVVLISGLQRSFMLCQVITILQDEGADVVSASCCTVANKVFHTLHAQVKISRIGVEISRIHERLQALVSL